MIPAVAADFAVQVPGLLAGIGALAAGTGLLVAGVRFGRFSARAEMAALKLVEHLDRVGNLQERQAVAQEKSALWAESNARLVLLLERMQDEREQLGRTLRVMSRRIEAISDDDEKDQTAARG